MFVIMLAIKLQFCFHNDLSAQGSNDNLMNCLGQRLCKTASEGSRQVPGNQRPIPYHSLKALVIIDETKIQHTIPSLSDTRRPNDVGGDSDKSQSLTTPSVSPFASLSPTDVNASVSIAPYAQESQSTDDPACEDRAVG